jgi:hypothetical protein
MVWVVAEYIGFERSKKDTDRLTSNSDSSVGPKPFRVNIAAVSSGSAQSKTLWKDLWIAANISYRSIEKTFSMVTGLKHFKKQALKSIAAELRYYLLDAHLAKTNYLRVKKPWSLQYFFDGHNHLPLVHYHRQRLLSLAKDHFDFVSYFVIYSHHLTEFCFFQTKVEQSPKD